MSGWTTKKLGEVCEIFRGGSPRPIKSFITNEPNGINWIKIGDTDLGGKYISSCAEKIKPSGVQYSRYVERGDFLISNSMSFGRPYILKINGCIHDGWLVIKKYEGTFDQDFLFYLLQSPSVQFQFNDLARGSTVRNLNRELVARVKVHYPETVAEQKRIVAKIDAAFEKIDRLKANAEKNLANAKELFQSALDEAMRPKKGWVEKRLGEVYNFSDYRGKTPTKIDQGIPLVTARNIRMGYLDYSVRDFISLAEYKTRQSRGIAHKGDILFTTEAPLGFVALADLDEFSTGQRVITFQQYEGSSFQLLNAFYYYYFQAKRFQSEIRKQATGATAQGIKASRLRDIPIAVVPIAEQKQIIKYLDFLSEKIKMLEQNYAQLIADCAEMRQAILREAFEGRMRTRRDALRNLAGSWIDSRATDEIAKDIERHRTAGRRVEL